jgi:hypothetical protein
VGIRRVLQLAAAHVLGRRKTARLAAREVGRLWSRVDRNDIARSWQQQLPAVVAVVTGGQVLAAGTARPYLDRLLAEYGLSADTDSQLHVARLAGVASDGRALESLMYQPVITALETIQRGGAVDEAMAAGAFSADLITRTQVTDAGRVADGLNVVAERSLHGYIRMLTLPSCSRCIILAGKFYEWNDGFERHPACDCVHIAAPEDDLDDLRTNPKKLFESMTEAEQAKTFTIAGAQAIRDGADMNQVVNVRRGAAGLSAAGARVTAAEVKVLRNGRDRGQLTPVEVFGRPLLVSTEGTTVRGVAGRRLGARVDGRKLPGARYRSARAPRLMPEQIYKIAGDDRDEALRLLYRNGYLLDRPKSAPVRVAKPERRPPPPPPPPKTFDERAAEAAVGAQAVDAPTFGLDRKARPEGFTQAMYDAVNSYLGAGHHGINSYLRGQRIPQGHRAADVHLNIAGLDATMAASKLDRDILTHRGVIDSTPMFGDRLDGDLTGMVWREDAFVSTTADQEMTVLFSLGARQGEKPMVMRILTPAGTPAVEVSNMRIEAEILLGRGLRLRVVADRGIDPDGIRHIDAEVLRD